MKQRIKVALAFAAVALIAAIVGYLWRVFRIGQTSKINEARTEDSGKRSGSEK